MDRRLSPVEGRRLVRTVAAFEEWYAQRLDALVPAKAIIQNAEIGFTQGNEGKRLSARSSMVGKVSRTKIPAPSFSVLFVSFCNPTRDYWICGRAEFHWAKVKSEADVSRDDAQAVEKHRNP